MWVSRAAELLLRERISTHAIALQARFQASKAGEAVDQQGFDLLLEMYEERGIAHERVLALQDELGLWITI